jgi:hypothetical protein
MDRVRRAGVGADAVVVVVLARTWATNNEPKTEVRLR